MALWKIDPIHSEIAFKVKHLVISNVMGHFTKFDAKVEAMNADLSDAKIQFEADVDSISTQNEQRDTHLKSADFFDASAYQKLSFVSKSVTKKSDTEFNIKGDITIRGITKEITLQAVFNGIAKGFGGEEIAGFEVTGKLNRFDFNLHWNALTEAGGIAVGETVRLDLSAEFKKAA